MRRVHLFLLALTMIAAGCSGDSGTDADNSATEPTQAQTEPETQPETETEPGTVFSWSGDDLSEWVTEDEMTDAFKDAATRYAGRDVDGEAVLVPGDRCRTCPWEWEIGRWRVGVHNPGGKYVGPPWNTDPRLPEGVTYEEEEEEGGGGPAGGYIVSGPNSDEVIAIYLWWPGYPMHPSGARELGAHEDMTFALASMLLQEMGWAD